MLSVFMRWRVGLIGTVLFVLGLKAPGQTAPFAYVTNFHSDTFSVIDVATNTVLVTKFIGSGPTGVAVSPDGSRTYVTLRCTSEPSCCEGQCGIDTRDPDTVAVIDTATNTVVGTVVVGSEPVAVAVAPDGERAYVANNEYHSRHNGTVSVIDTTTNAVVATITVGDESTALAITPDGSAIYVTNYGSDTVSVISTATNTVVASIGVGDRPQGVAITPDGARAYVTTSQGDVYVIDTATNTVEAIVGVGIDLRGIVISPSGARAYVAVAHVLDTVSVIDTQTNMVVAAVGVGNKPTGVAMTPDGAFVYVTNFGDEKFDNDAVSVIDTTTNAVVATINVGDGPTGIAITPLPSADLALTKTDSPDPVTVGNNLTYTVTATNNGPGAATGVVVTDTLPSDVTFVSSSASQGSCSGTSTITCTLGSLAKGSEATVMIGVTPTATGTLSNTVSVTSNETDSNTANNTATAVTTVSSPPTLSVSPTSLDFGNVTVNSTKDLTFTVTNSGEETLTGSVTTSSPFSIVSGSSFSLGAGASQTVTVRFSPTTTGTFLGTASVSSNGGNAAVTLSGTGTPAPSLSVSTTSLDSGNVTVNSTKDLTFTVTNNGGGTLTGSVTASSPFSIVSGGSFSLTAGAIQTVTVRFSPTSTGTFTGTATVSSNGGSATVSLSGTGTEEQVPLLLVTPTSLDFGGVTVGSSSDLSFTVTNSGGGTLAGTATTNLPFSIVSGGSFSLAAGATQTVTVRFSPTSTGAFADIVSVSSNGGDTSVTLSGTGTEVSSPVLSVFPTALDFGEVAINSSKDLLFTVTNTGTGTLTGTVTASSPFSVISGSSFSLGTGASQTITVRFSPTVESFVSSTAAVNSNGGNTVVTLTGTGTAIQTPLLSVTPPSLDFGGVLVGSSLDLLFFVQNSGGGTLVGTVSTTAPGFSIVSGNSFSLTAGATQVVTVRFSPTEGGTFSGTVTVSSNGGGAAVTVTGVGESVPQPTLTITPSILNFGSVRVGKSKDLSFTLQNTGEGTLAGTATATDPFNVVTNSSFTLEAGDLVLVTVRFSPPTTGTFTGTVKFASNGGNMTAAVTGRGRGRP